MLGTGARIRCVQRPQRWRSMWKTWHRGAVSIQDAGTTFLRLGVCFDSLPVISIVWGFFMHPSCWCGYYSRSQSLKIICFHEEISSEPQFLPRCHLDSR